MGSVQITIKLSQSSKEAHLEVIDNGLGVPETDRANIFNVFRRLQPRQFSGTGIGLSICQRVVEGQRGRNWVTDRDDQVSGAVFHVTLPTVSPPGTH